MVHKRVEISEGSSSKGGENRWSKIGHDKIRFPLLAKLKLTVDWLGGHTVTKQRIPAILLYHNIFNEKPIPGHVYFEFESLSIIFDAGKCHNKLLRQDLDSTFLRRSKICFMVPVISQTFSSNSREAYFISNPRCSDTWR